MRTGRYLLVAALTGASLACSCVGSVVIANPTDHPVTIFLTPERGDSTGKYCDCPHGYLLTSYRTFPSVVPRELERGEWTPVDSTAFHWDTTGRAPRLTVAVVLPAGSSLRIGDAAYDCSGGVIGLGLPAQIVIVDGTKQTTLDAIGFKDRARQATKWLLLYEIPGVPAGTAS